MNAVVTYLGRAVALHPASLGKLFEEHCTVDVMEQVPASEENGWKREQKVFPRKMFWYDKEYFCAFSGYTDFILKTLGERGIPVEFRDNCDSGLEEPDLSKLAGTTWRTKQPEVMSALMAYRNGIIKAPTGFGKSFLIKKLAQVYPSAKIIITVSSRDIARDLYNSLRIDLPDLGMIGDGKRKRGRVVVALAQSLHHCDVNANIVLADEVHTLGTDNFVEKLTNFMRAKFFGFSASPEGRSDNADGMLEALFGPVRVTVGYQEAVGHGSIVDIKVRMIPIRVGMDVSGSTDKTWVDRMGIWTNNLRNEAIAKAAIQVAGEIGEDEQILLMVDKIEHAYRLGQLLPDYTVVTGELPADKAALFLRKGAMQPGQVLCSPEQREEYKQQFMKGTLKRVIATKIWSKGVDFRDLAVLIRADGLASQIDSHQIPGRLSRLGDKQAKLHGILIDCYDLFSRNLKARSEARMRIYRGNGWEVDQFINT